MVESPQLTGCKSIEMESEGLTNGVLSQLTTFGYTVKYDESVDTDIFGRVE